MTAPGRDVRLMQQQAGELDARLAAARHAARSGDRLVTVVVTGQGKLLDLRIEDRALHGAHVQKLGLSIVEAVRAARAAASASALPQLNALFGKPPPPILPVVLPHPPAVAEPARREPEPVDEENFEELDFLTDEPEPGGGRW
ncbi:YbaB/EbfC family nucleoid-associated protein [Amycolatopsis sp.]|uniref:YbaB/EbfC family nucleoid-associated protein n=1 Tax=Amycolatopsis sp. TaxID=37632 RepID=UPI002D7F2342|nr:YbaB/EbfC family nucleoid-associated protein [Amycolatopsis sp.]HET6703896.1 YbaB/EbfC family nucleoid-associated protein [Amycolatopsis sp.]